MGFECLTLTVDESFARLKFALDAQNTLRALGSRAQPLIGRA